MKIKIKKILKPIIFTSIILVLLSASSYILRDKESTLNGFYSEPDNSKDVLIVGSSHVNNGVIPSIIWADANMSAYNVYSWSQPMWISYHYIVEALKTQTPKVIILESYGMVYGHSHAVPEEIDKVSYANSFNIKPSLNFLKMIKTSEDVGIDIRKYEEFLNLPRYHSRWKNFDLDMVTYNQNDQKDYLRGYGIVFNTGEKLSKPQLDETVIPFEPYEFSVEYLEKIVKLCEKNDVELILTMTPYIYNETEVGIFNWIDEFADNNDLTFLNYCLDDGDRIGFDYTTDLQDMSHANFYGARKISEDLAQILKNKYPNEIKESNADFENAEYDAEKYKRVLIANDVLTQTTIDGYLSEIIKVGGYTVFIADSGKNEDITKEILNKLNSINFDIEDLDYTDGYNAIINLEGENYLNQYAISDEKIGDILFSEINPTSIMLNGEEVMKDNETLKIVIYDNILEKPLSLGYINENGEFKNREFTSDIAYLYKK